MAIRGKLKRFFFYKTFYVLIEQFTKVLLILSFEAIGRIVKFIEIVISKQINSTLVYSTFRKNSIHIRFGLIKLCEQSLESGSLQ
ncbi:MAG: hypothetical protein CMJ17_12045 [Phenylobacterium sp.]|nr:hypothetical protein [Phenylobacterium sp.]